MTTPDYIRAHRHSIFHRDEVLASALCSCFSCKATFPPSEIVEWVDDVTEGMGQTAECPRCGMDCVIGAESGYPVTDYRFLTEMQNYWISGLNPDGIREERAPSRWPKASSGSA